MKTVFLAWSARRDDTLIYILKVLHTLLAWQGVAMGKKRIKIWTTASFCLFWTLWCARNRLAFENKVTSAQRIKINFISNLWSLTNLFGNDTTNSVLDFLTWLGCKQFLRFLSCLLCVWLPLSTSCVLIEFSFL